MATYICNLCKKPFSFPIQISYQEYPGARSWPEDASPCCVAGFEESEETALNG